MVALVITSILVLIINDCKLHYLFHIIEIFNYNNMTILSISQVLYVLIVGYCAHSLV